MPPRKARRSSLGIDMSPGGSYSTSLPGWKGRYCRLSQRVQHHIQQNWFHSLIIGSIFIAGVLVGVQTYPCCENNIVIEAIDGLVVAIFAIECILKIISEELKPWNYFFGEERAWNIFDFTIVLACIFLPVILSGDGSMVSMLRLIRVVRVIKLFKKFPQLQMIVGGLIGGVASMGYILALLALFMFLYACTGVFLFRSNDPFHFNSMVETLSTLWRMATLDWASVLYINMEGCMIQDKLLYWSNCSDVPQGKIACVANATIAESPACKALDVVAVSEGKFYSATVFFISYIVLASWIMLSLFMGAVTTAMSTAIATIKEAKAERMLQAQLKEKDELLQRSRNVTVGSTLDLSTDSKEVARQVHLSKLHLTTNGSDEISSEELQTAVQSDYYLAQLTTVDRKRFWRERKGINTLEEFMFQESSGLVLKSTGREDAPNYFAYQYAMFALKCETILDHPVTRSIIFTAVLMVGVVVVINIETDEENEGVHRVLKQIEDGVLLIFALEVVLAIVAEAFRPWAYFYQGWNCFDFLVVVVSLLPDSSDYLMFRLCRLLRIVKMMRSIESLNVVVSGLMDGIASCPAIGAILLMIYYLFAVVGVTLFKQNDPWYFGSLGRSMLTLFQVSTLDNWIEIMYINQYGCDYYGYGDVGWPRTNMCTSPSAQGVVSVIFFVTFTILSGLVLLSLFLGVVTMSMEGETEKFHKHQQRVEHVERLIKADNDFDSESASQLTTAFEMTDLDNSTTLNLDEMATMLNAVHRQRGGKPVKIDKHKMDQLIEDFGMQNNVQDEFDLPHFMQFLIMFRQKQSGSTRNLLGPRVGNEGTDGEEGGKMRKPSITTDGVVSNPMSHREGTVI